MALACNKNNVVCGGHGAGCLYSLLTVLYDNDFLHQFLIKSCSHVTENVRRVLKTWVVRCQNYVVTLLCCYLSHDRAFAFVTVAAAANHRNESAVFRVLKTYVIYCVYNIVKCVRGVGVVHNGQFAVSANHLLESARYW